MARLGTFGLLLRGGSGTAYWWQHRPPDLPPGIAVSNDRLEVDEIDVDTKFAGRVSEILADGGSMVKAGQVVARIDTCDLQEQLSQARSQVAQAQQMVAQNAADLAQMIIQLKLTGQELQRARILAKRGDQTQEVVTSDNRSSTLLSQLITIRRRGLPPQRQAWWQPHAAPI